MMTIQITDAAITHLKKMIQQKNAKAFRLSVKESGCNGYRYYPEIIQEISTNDVQIKISQELLVVIDPQAIPYIEGTVVDYVATGLGQAQLQFKNPNVTGECGCGESFTIKKEQADD